MKVAAAAVLAMATLTACGSSGSTSPGSSASSDAAVSTPAVGPCLDAGTSFTYAAAGALTNSPCKTATGTEMAFLWGGKCPDGSIQVWQRKVEATDSSPYWHLKVKPGQTAIRETLPASDPGYLGSNCTTKIDK